MTGTPARRLAVVTAGLVLLLLAYLALWPVPISPRAWQPPADAGHRDPYTGDDRLRHARLLGLDGFEGPEDATPGPDGRIYFSTRAGQVARIVPGSDTVEAFAETGGRPLGIEFDVAGRLLVANAELGLQRIGADGSVERLLEDIDGEPLVYANDVAVAADGRIFVSEATTHFAPARWGGTYAASLLDIMEHGGSGRIIEYEPRRGRARVFAASLDFANGVAVSADQRWLLVAETGAYRIWRYPLAGGERELVVDNLPDFPDNLNNGLQGRIWVGLIAPRNALLDRLAGRPFLRRVVQRLPAFLRPAAEAHSHVIAIDVDGRVLMNLEDSAGRLPALTGVAETKDSLYLTSLFGNALGRLDKRDLARP